MKALLSPMMTVRHEWNRRLALIAMLTLILVTFGDFAQAHVIASMKIAIGNAELRQWDGQSFSSIQFRDLFGKGIERIVLLQRDTNCPIGKKTTPYAQALVAKKIKGVRFVLINFKRDLDIQKPLIDNDAKAFKNISYLADPEQDLAKWLNITTTTEMAVLDSSYNLIYRGPINSAFGIGVTREKFKNTLEEFLKKNRTTTGVDSVTLESPGCYLEYASDSKPSAFADQKLDDIRPLLIQKCLPCHETSELNGIKLDSVADFRRVLKTAQFVLEKRIMPPVDLDPKGLPVKVPYLTTDKERSQILKWLKHIESAQSTDESKPLRDDTDKNRKNSAVAYDTNISLLKNFKVPATGSTFYKKFFINNPYNKDVYVSATKVEVTNPQIVHHVHIRLSKGRSKLQREDNPFGDEINHIGGFAPGVAGFEIPETASVLIPAKSSIFVVAHFSPNGLPQDVSINLKLKLTDDEARKKSLFRQGVVFRSDIVLLKNTARTYTSEYIVPFSIKLYALLPHMHLRGEKARIWLRRKGTSKDLLLLGVNRFFFHNQINYGFETPLQLKTGDKLIVEYDYNNTSSNIFNPDPGVDVRSGRESLDEMFYLALRWVQDSDEAE